MQFSAAVSRIKMPQNKPFTVSVSQLNRKISLMLKGEKSFSDLCVRGEISNLTIHYKSGHIYFSLKDEAASVKAVMFRSFAEKLAFLPEDGMSVIVRGSVQCYEKDGVYQIYASEIIPEGIGVQAAALEQLKVRLEKEGLFSQKRNLPDFPEKICVITAETGAAIQDIINIIGRRYPIAQIILLPVLVQGENAPDSIVSAFAKSGKTGADLIIFGRGGGSAEDLSAFNDERVVRAIFDSSIPTISAVGHETDVTLSDFAADLRAPTPSAAAELAVPDINEIMISLTNMSEYFSNRITDIIDRYDTSVQLLSDRIQLKNPIYTISANEQKITASEAEIKDRFTKLIAEKEYALSEKAAVISALNPLSVLMRGYSITYKDKKAVSSASELSVGDEIEIRLNSGKIKAVVKQTEE